VKEITDVLFDPAKEYANTTTRYPKRVKTSRAFQKEGMHALFANSGWQTPSLFNLSKCANCTINSTSGGLSILFNNCLLCQILGGEKVIKPEERET